MAKFYYRCQPGMVHAAEDLLLVVDIGTCFGNSAGGQDACIREINIISTPHDMPLFEELLGDGEKWGLSLSKAVRPSPEVPAQAFLISKLFVGQNPSALIVGDSIFYGHDLSLALRRAGGRTTGGTVCAYPAQDPER